jgi:hypothetical protein
MTKDRQTRETQPPAFSEEWKTLVADAIAKSPRRRTEYEKQQIRIAMKQNKPEAQ